MSEKSSTENPIGVGVIPEALAVQESQRAEHITMKQWKSMPTGEILNSIFQAMDVIEERKETLAEDEISYLLWLSKDLVDLVLSNRFQEVKKND
jgi:hypothetical protein